MEIKYCLLHIDVTNTMSELIIDRLFKSEEAALWWAIKNEHSDFSILKVYTHDRNRKK